MAARVLSYYLGLEQIWGDFLGGSNHSGLRRLGSCNIFDVDGFAPLALLACTSRKEPGSTTVLIAYGVLEDALLNFGLFLLECLLIAESSLEAFIKHGGTILGALGVGVVILDGGDDVCGLLLVILLHTVLVAKKFVNVFHPLFLEQCGLLLVAFGLLMETGSEDLFFLHALDLALLSEQGQNFAVGAPGAHFVERRNVSLLLLRELVETIKY